MRISNLVMFSGETEIASFALDLGETPDRYLIMAMSGIDADGITPRFYSFGQRTGRPFFDFGLPPREIVFRIALNPKFLLDETFSELRDDLYKAISSSRNGEIRMLFKSGPAVIAQIYGFVVKLEAAHFTKSPEVQLTIRCDDPFFRGINPVTFLSEDLGLTNPITIVDSLSTAPHGFYMAVDFNDVIDADGLTIRDTASDPEWSFAVFPEGGFIEGDSLQLSTETRNKYVQILRDGDIIPIADSIEPGSVWPMIFPGVNTFHYVEMTSVESFVITSYPAYWGV